jgi:predicted regulator of Ras-like GTPase activity (Roadblock/LC7/MglB family)
MTTNNSNIPNDISSAANLPPDQDQAFERVLRDLKDKCPAQFIMLIDTSGHLVSVHGESGKTDLVALGALIAGDLAASQEIARLTGQYQHAQLILREGPNATTFLSEAGQQLALYMRIDKDVPMGWARLLILEASRQLAQAMSTPSRDRDKLDLGLGDEKLANLIGDGLDSIWNG